MNPIFFALLTSWNWRIEILLPLLIGGVLFSLGWGRLRARSQRRLATLWRLVSFWVGLLILILALMSGIDILGGQLFFMHMIQHILLIMFAPPLIFLANPFPFILWGLPPTLRMQVGALFVRESAFRRLLASATHLALIWFLFLAILVGWHDPVAYNLALRSSWVHDLEHLSFYITAMLFWWQIVGAGPRIHARNSAMLRVIFLLLSIPPSVAIGGLLSFVNTPIYSHYTQVPRIWGISVMLDQQIAGVIMWIPSSMMYLIAILVILAGVLGQEEKKPVRHVENWSTDEALIAPGLEHRSVQNRWRNLQKGKGVDNVKPL